MGSDGFEGFGDFGLRWVSEGSGDQELQKTCGTKFLPSWGWHNAAGNAVRLLNLLPVGDTTYAYFRKGYQLSDRQWSPRHRRQSERPNPSRSRRCIAHPWEMAKWQPLCIWQTWARKILAIFSTSVGKWATFEMSDFYLIVLFLSDFVPKKCRYYEGWFLDFPILEIAAWDDGGRRHHPFQGVIRTKLPSWRHKSSKYKPQFRMTGLNWWSE